MLAEVLILLALIKGSIDNDGIISFIFIIASVLSVINTLKYIRCKTLCIKQHQWSTLLCTSINNNEIENYKTMARSFIEKFGDEYEK